MVGCHRSLSPKRSWYQTAVGGKWATCEYPSILRHISTFAMLAFSSITASESCQCGWWLLTKILNNNNNNNNNNSHDVCTIRDIRGRESIDILLSTRMSSNIKQPFLKIRSKTVITLSQAEIIELRTEDPLCVSLSLSLWMHPQCTATHYPHRQTQSVCGGGRERVRRKKKKKHLWRFF